MKVTVKGAICRVLLMSLLIFTGSNLIGFGQENSQKNILFWPDPEGGAADGRKKVGSLRTSEVAFCVHLFLDCTNGSRDHFYDRANTV